MTVSAAPAETPSAGCASATFASGVHQLADGDLSRTYRAFVPSGIDAARPAPLALVFHGWGEDENAFLDAPVVTAEADARGFILVAARGTGSEGGDESYNSWTFRGSATGIGGDGQPICGNPETNYAYKSCGPVGQGISQSGCAWTHCQTDDIAFVKALVAEVSSKACVDMDRVFATGGSNGGMFTWELGQNPETAPMLRAIAPLIGLPHRGFLDGPGRPDGLPALLITGVDDPTVPPGAWEDPGFSTTADADLYDYTGATGITRVWAQAHQCAVGAPAQSVAFGAEGIDCRSYCGADASGLPPVLDCRAQMAHDYGLDKTWPMILSFFAGQPPR
jgi:polyhydroxybutyrate depolymerase